MINGNPQEDSIACSGSCSTTAPGNIGDIAGIFAAHEQFQVSGNPNLFGFIVSEDAIDCSPVVNAMGNGTSTIDGDPNVFYDCNNPPNPWNTGEIKVVSWEEVD